MLAGFWGNCWTRFADMVGFNGHLELILNIVATLVDLEDDRAVVVSLFIKICLYIVYFNLFMTKNNVCL